MVTIYKNERTKIGITGNTILVELRGLSTDEKPIKINNKKIDNGSTFIEIDTGKQFMYDLENKEWNEVSSGDSANSNIYSTTETQIGTYLDKPLYRKVIVVEPDVVRTLHGKNQEIAHNISNMDEATFYSGRFAKEDGTSWVFGDKSQTSPYTNIRYVGSTNIVIDMPTGDTWNMSTLYVIVEYTKTTD